MAINLETCHSKELPLKNQPIGATGAESGAIETVKLRTYQDSNDPNNPDLITLTTL